MTEYRPEARPEQRPEQRIAKLLARAGVASRRQIERMIVEGRIALNGKPLDTPATLLRSLHGVTVDGQPIAAPPPARLFLYHKPPGLLVTERDPGGRPTIYDRLPADLPRLVPVGRLDLATEGLLLLTTDGGLKRTLELPATGVQRAYRARAYGDIQQTQLEDLIEGVEIDGVRYGPIDANLERRTGANTWVELILTEGKNREVRRVLEHLGLQVSRLIRTRYGPFLLGDLTPGQIGEVRQHDLIAFRKSLGNDTQSAEPVEVEARLVPPRHGEGDRQAKPGGGGVATTRARPADRTRPEPPAPARGRAEPRLQKDSPRRERPARTDRGQHPTSDPTRSRAVSEAAYDTRTPRPPGRAKPGDRPDRPTREGAAKPPRERTARPPRDATARPPRDGAARPPRDGSVRPSRDGATRPPRDGAPRPPRSDGPRPPRPKSPGAGTASRPPRGPARSPRR